MAKSKTAKAAKPKARKEKTPKTPKASKPRPTQEQITEDQLKVLFFQYKRKLKPLLVAEANAKDAVRKLYEQAKKEGVTKKELELAIKLESDEGEEKIGAEVSRTLRIARWMGATLGTQLEMFEQSSAEKDFEDGKRAALDDQIRKPPAHLSQAAEQRWLAGYAEGVTQVNKTRESGFKPLGDVALGVVADAAGAEAVDSLAQPQAA